MKLRAAKSTPENDCFLLESVEGGESLARVVDPARRRAFGNHVRRLAAVAQSRADDGDDASIALHRHVAVLAQIG